MAAVRAEIADREEGVVVPWAFELYLDEGSAAIIRALGMQPRSSPHISLGVTESIQGRVEDALCDWATRQQPIAVTLDHWGLFLSETAVLFLGVRERATLAEVYWDMHRVTEGLLGGEWTYYLPNHWVPHCTVAEDVALADLGAVAKCVQTLELPVHASLCRLAVVQFGGRRVERWTVPLGTGRSGDAAVPP